MQPLDLRICCIFALVNFNFKSRARIQILTIWTTFTELFCAIRIMFSVVLRSNTAGGELGSFLEHVRKVRASWQQIRRIPRTRVTI